MNRLRVWSVTIAVCAVVVPCAVGLGAQAPPNGEATSFVPIVEREPYDARVFMAPLALGESERNGRRLVAQRCANCHGANPRQPGPLLGKPVVESRGEAFIREKVKKGSTLMPGFEHTLQPAQIDEIMSFLRTYMPPTRSAPAAQE